MRNLFLIYLVIQNVLAHSQTEFFNSKINFSNKELNNFYSSFNIDSTQVYFNANDYTIYTYDKKSGALNWSYYSGNKSNVTPKLNQSSVFVEKHLSEYENRCMQLNTKTGDTLQLLKIEALNTQPVFSGDIMFCSAISPGIGGAILAYDLKKNNIVWQNFIAHGVSVQPYYFKNKIIANAEGDNWFELDYNGVLLDTNCKKKANLYVENIKCVRNFKYLTHNQKEISTINFEDYESLKIKYTKNKTFIIGENKILIINNQNKIEKEINLEETLSDTENKTGFYTEILKADTSTVWFIYLSTLVVYDFENNKTIQTFDLNKWHPHQAILDENNLWLISKDDGELIGLNLK